MDHCLGTVGIPACIRSLGAQCETLKAHFEIDVPDAIWIPEVTRKGWVILTADRNILKNPLERNALQNAGARYIGISCASQTTVDTAVLDSLMRVAPVPVLARLLRSGPQFMSDGKWLDVLGGNVDPFAAVLDAAQRPDRPAAYLLEYALHVLRRFGTLSNAESVPVLYRHFRRAHLALRHKHGNSRFWRNRS